MPHPQETFTSVPVEVNVFFPSTALKLKAPLFDNGWHQGTVNGVGGQEGRHAKEKHLLVRQAADVAEGLICAHPACGSSLPEATLLTPA
jgi:hypothetical protein